MQEERIEATDYSEIMKRSYIDYAMSVIVSRAIPDVRDGLKPVQRRVLYDMNELGLRNDKPYRKSARIVGDTMGKYHPHGDSSIYDALVVLSQDFKKNLPLVDGHGNFGNIDGDSAAAMRYTEARLQEITEKVFLSDLDTIPFQANFDETEKEPTVLPVKIPNLLVNGAEGIAVGMATSIPSHNLGEVVDAVKATLKNPDITLKELMKYIKGPDFSTGGIVVNQSDLYNIYETGKGKIRIRGKVELENLKGGKQQIVVTEIPYTMIGSNISKFLCDVLKIVETKELTEIADISDSSSKGEIRLIFELKKDANAEKVINTLYKKTKLEDTLGVNMLAVHNGVPTVMGLKEIITSHIDFQYEIYTKKYQHMLEKALELKEVQEGLIKAYECLDLVIKIIRGSTSKKQAKECFVSGVTDGIQFKTEKDRKQAAKLLFTDIQAEAILNLRLYNLVGLEISALEKAFSETVELIGKYQNILSDRKVMSQTIIEELSSIKKKFATPRKTEIIEAEEIILEKEEIKKEEYTILIDRLGYARAVSRGTYEKNKDAAETENKYIIHCLNIDKICIFTDNGNLHLIKVLDLPYGRFREKGRPIDNFCNYSASKEKIILISSLDEIKTSNLLFATKTGMVKIVKGNEFDVTRRTILATKLEKEDEVVFIHKKTKEEFIVIQTNQGYFLRFGLEEIPEKKKTAVGVQGIKMQDGDFVTNIYCFAGGSNIIAQYNNQDIHLNRLKLNKRASKGSKK